MRKVHGNCFNNLIPTENGNVTSKRSKVPAILPTTLGKKKYGKATTMPAAYKGFTLCQHLLRQAVAMLLQSLEGSSAAFADSGGKALQIRARFLPTAK